MENIFKRWLFANIALTIGCCAAATIPHIPLAVAIAAVSASVMCVTFAVCLMVDAVEETVKLIKERKSE